MKKFTALIAVMVAVASVAVRQAKAQDFDAGTLRTIALAVPAHTSTPQTVSLENTRLDRVMIPVSVFQKIGTATGDASTNTTTMAYLPNGGTTAFRIGGLTAQTYGAESATSLSNCPPLYQGDALQLTGTALSNLTYFVTYGLVPKR